MISGKKTHDLEYFQQIDNWPIALIYLYVDAKHIAYLLVWLYIMFLVCITYIRLTKLYLFSKRIKSNNTKFLLVTSKGCHFNDNFSWIVQVY